MRNEKDGRFTRSLIYGVGIDDVDGTKEYVDETGKRKTNKCFNTWKNMLKRCYHPTGEYKGKVTICDAWSYFSKFKVWYDENYKQGYELDKDICGGKIYSPNTCVFIPREVNTYIIGVNDECGFYYEEGRNKYQSYCQRFKGKRKSLGRFDTKEEAVMHSKLFKIGEINELMGSINDLALKIKLSELCDRMFLNYVIPKTNHKFSIVNLKDYC